MRFKSVYLILSLLFLVSCDPPLSDNPLPVENQPDSGSGIDDSEDDPAKPIESALIHEVDGVHGGWATVGASQYINGYRGIYWIGPSCRIDEVEILLNVNGDVSSVNYRMGVWSVDPGNHLALVEETSQSVPVSGSNIQPDPNDGYGGNLGDWVRFSFSEPALMISGSSALLIYRDDGVFDIDNYIQVNNPYDTNDLINDQANLHYNSEGIMAGRSPGDEDQPEPFAVKIRLYGEVFNVADSKEYPAQPIRLTYAPGSIAGTVDLAWEYRSTAVLPRSYRIYQYHPDRGDKTLLGSPAHSTDQAVQQYRVTDLNSGSDYFFVVTAVSPAGNESYHSLLPENSQSEAEAVTAP